MGREIETILRERGHEVALIIDMDNAAELDAAHLQGIDVALEFTTPATAYRNIRTCIECGTPVVSGTTGWTDRLPELQALCRERGGALFYASNYCLGVNLMFRLNRQLAEMMNRVGGYEVRIEEVHHTQKKDAPSGTAITLAEGIIDRLDTKQGWVNYAPGIEHAANRVERSEETPADCVEIRSVREGAVPGIHTVSYESEDDRLEIRHTIKNRRRRRGRGVPLRKEGCIRHGRSAEIIETTDSTWEKSRLSSATDGWASRWPPCSIRSGSWCGPATSGCCSACR